MKFKSNIEIQASVEAGGSTGSSGQVLSSTGTGVAWINQVDVVSSADSAESIHISVKNTSGAQILKGTPVYVTGETGNSGKIEVAPADASDSAKMPALGLLESTLSNNGEGLCVQGGLLEGLATATIDGTATTANDTVYVKSGGGLTMTKPTGTGLIQNIAKVARAHASNGTLVVSSILRTNDVPNLTTGKIWVGDGNTVESTVVHLDEVNGRMGIGTDSPTLALDVRGTQGSPSSSGTSQTGSLSIRGGGSHFMSSGMLNVSPWTGWFQAQDANNLATTYPLALNPNGGNVGIGQTSPSEKLEVIGTIKQKTGAGYSNYVQQSVSEAQLTFSTFSVNQTSHPSAIKFSPNGSEAMRVDNDGNVGIGTTSPSEKLNVSGNILATGTILGSNLSGTNTGDQDLSGYALTSHLHDNTTLDMHFGRETQNIDTYDPDSFWATSRGTGGLGTYPGNYYNIYNFAGNGSSEGTQLATYYGGNNKTYIRSRSDSGNVWLSWEQVWTSGTDGANSGLDADLLDGQHASDFATATHNHDSRYLRKDTSDAMAGVLTLNSGGTNTYGRIRGYENDNHFITIRGGVQTGTDTLNITAGHQTTFVEHADSSSEGWYFVSKASGNYTELGRLDGLGNMFTTGSHRSPFFYDTDDTNYYLDPDGGSSLNDLTVSGILQVGTDVRSRVYYDLDNVTYYGDFAGTSNLNNLTLNGTTNIGASGAYKHITVDGDANTYYPVVISGSGGYGFHSYSVSRRYNDPAPDTWNTSTHRGGLTFTFKWSSDTAWGGNHKSIRVIEFGESYSNMLGGIQLAKTGGIVVWLRGGGARYTIHAPNGNAVVATTYLSGFTDGSGTNFPIRTTRVTSEWEDKWALRGDNDLLRVDTVEALASLKAPIFYDSNDTAFYVDPNSTSRFNKIQTSTSGATPRYDTAFYVVQGQHWYGDTDSQVMYLGESGNDVLLRGQMSIGGTSITSGYALTMGGSINANNTSVNYVDQLHFNDNVRFYDAGDDSYLNFKYGDATTGGIRFRNGGDTIKGYLYASDGGFGLLDNDGNWAVRTQTGTDPLILHCDANPEFYVHTSYTLSPGSSRAPIFYDSNDTGYYLDPAGNSQLTTLYYNEWLRNNRSTSSGLYWESNTPGAGWHIYPQDQQDMIFRPGADNGGIKCTAANGATRGYIHWTTGNEIGFLNPSRGWSFRADSIGNNFASVSSRAPIFYDSNNTAYYLDPGSTSQVGHLNCISTLSFGGFTAGTKGTLFEGYSTHSVVRNDAARLDFYMGKTTTGVGTMMSLTDSGRVGIGTAGPSEKLHVSGNIKLDDGYSVRWDASGRVSAGDELVLASSSSTIVLDGSDSAMYFKMGSTTVIYFRDDYNVGIGTNDPSEKLDVDGTIKAIDYKGYLPAFQHGGFLHSVSSSSTVIYWIPTNNIVETTSTQYYNVWVAPYSGRVKRIVMRWTNGPTPTATSVTFRKAINGTTSGTTYPATVTGAGTTSMIVARDFLSTDIAFQAGDNILIGFTTDGGTRLLQGVAYTVVLEYNIS